MQSFHVKKCSDLAGNVDISNDNDHISLRVYMTIVGMTRQVSVQENVLDSLLLELKNTTERRASCGLYKKNDIRRILEEILTLTGALQAHIRSLT